MIKKFLLASIILMTTFVMGEFFSSAQAQINTPQDLLIQIKIRERFQIKDQIADVQEQQRRLTEKVSDQKSRVNDMMAAVKSFTENFKHRIDIATTNAKEAHQRVRDLLNQSSIRSAKENLSLKMALVKDKISENNQKISDMQMKIRDQQQRVRDLNDRTKMMIQQQKDFINSRR